jgi:hypothetical protein
MQLINGCNNNIKRTNMITLQAEKALFGSLFQTDLVSMLGAKKFFAVKSNGGSLPNLKGMSLSLKAKKNVLPFDTKEEYDAVVIGGGTGGLSFIQEARKLGLKVAVFNYVEPTPKHNFKWGLGGT